jgi:membrane protein
LKQVARRFIETIGPQVIAVFRTYGSLGAGIGMMMWMWISSIVILFGAQLNSEIEHQTVRDSTVRGDKPLGARGAVMADTVGKAQYP